MRARIAVTFAVAVVALTSGCSADHPPDGVDRVSTATAGSGTEPSGATSSGGSGSQNEGLPSTGSTRAPLGATAPAVPRLTMPLPATASARGSLVTGFPVSIVPDGATVVSSSVSAEGSRLQVGLAAGTSVSPAGVLADYVKAFTTAGFTTVDSPAAPGTSATAFIRGNDGLVLTLRERLGGGAELSVAGTLVAQG